MARDCRVKAARCSQAEEARSMSLVMAESSALARKTEASCGRGGG
jgi:hypothetical protein